MRPSGGPETEGWSPGTEQRLGCASFLELGARPDPPCRRTTRLQAASSGFRLAARGLLGEPEPEGLRVSAAGEACRRDGRRGRRLLVRARLRRQEDVERRGLRPGRAHRGPRLLGLRHPREGDLLRPPARASSCASTTASPRTRAAPSTSRAEPRRRSASSAPARGRSGWRSSSSTCRPEEDADAACRVPARHPRPLIAGSARRGRRRRSPPRHRLAAAAPRGAGGPPRAAAAVGLLLALRHAPAARRSGDLPAARRAGGADAQARRHPGGPRDRRPSRAARGHVARLVAVEGGAETASPCPEDAEVHDVSWTADGRRFALTVRHADHMGLWVGSVRRRPDRGST